MKLTSAPLSDSIITVVANLIDDSQADTRRDPSHSDLDFLIKRVGLDHADPKTQGQSVGKAKRIRAVLSWAIENNETAGEKLIKSLIDIVSANGGFRLGSTNYVGKESIDNTIAAFRVEGYELSIDGELRPLLLDNLSEQELTAALMAYVRRARKGIIDAALLVGTGKDLLEAVAKHVIMVRTGQSNVTNNFPTLLGQAFVTLNLATPHHKEKPNESATFRYERSLYELGCSVNSLRNKEGTGHGRPFLPSISLDEAKNAVQAMGIVAEYMLAKLVKN